MTTPRTIENGPVRPEDVLPEEASRTEINGVDVRKGTVAAFLRNAMQWSDPATSEPDRETIGHAIAGAMPALRALGIFDVFTVRDDRLRSMMEHC